MKATRNEVAINQSVRRLHYVCVNLKNGLCLEGIVMKVGTHDFVLCSYGNNFKIKYKDIIGINGF